MVLAQSFSEPGRVQIQNYFNLPTDNPLGMILEAPTTDDTSIQGTGQSDRVYYNTATEKPEINGTDGDDVIDALAGDDDVFGGAGAGPWGRDVIRGGVR